MGWTLEQAPSMEGKVVVVTGANSGIGWEAAWMLAKKGATVVMACRDPGRATEAKERLLQKVPGATVEMLRLDLSSLASVREAAGELIQRHPKLYALINNAGVMALPYRKTEDGFEMQFGTNHLGHFALTGLLLPHIDGRVVTVSSVMHRAGRIRFDDLNGEKSYSPWPFYGQSKLANLLFMSELDRRLRKAGSPVKSVACHPGYAATNLQTVAPKMNGSSVMEAFNNLGNALLAQSAEMGATPTVFAATMPEVEGGDYCGPSIVDVWGPPKKVGRNAASRDEVVASRLWEESERLTGVKFLD